MMLVSFLNSFKRGLFNEKNPCVAVEDKIEKYIQILLPLYIFTNDIQSIKSTIGCIVPSILTISYANLDRMILDDENQNLLRNNLIHFIKQKFEFELTSKVYLVSAL